MFLISSNMISSQQGSYRQSYGCCCPTSHNGSNTSSTRNDTALPLGNPFGRLRAFDSCRARRSPSWHQKHYQKCFRLSRTQKCCSVNRRCCHQRPESIRGCHFALDRIPDRRHFLKRKATLAVRGTGNQLAIKSNQKGLRVTWTMGTLPASSLFVSSNKH